MGLAPVQPDPEFCTFVDIEHGVRAAAKTLLSYERHFAAEGRKPCVANIVARWAPPSENDAAAYATDVAQRLCVSLTVPLDLHEPATLRALVAALARHENGIEIDPGAVRRGVDLALG